MTRIYDCKTPPNRAPAACYPGDNAGLACKVCARWRRGEPANYRRPVVIDASTVIRDGICPMHIQRPAVRPYSEVQESVNAPVKEEA